MIRNKMAHRQWNLDGCPYFWSFVQFQDVTVWNLLHAIFEQFYYPEGNRKLQHCPSYKPARGTLPVTTSDQAFFPHPEAHLSSDSSEFQGLFGFLDLQDHYCAFPSFLSYLVSLDFQRAYENYLITGRSPFSRAQLPTSTHTQHLLCVFVNLGIEHRSL